MSFVIGRLVIFSFFVLFRFVGRHRYPITRSDYTKNEQTSIPSHFFDSETVNLGCNFGSCIIVALQPYTPLFFLITRILISYPTLTTCWTLAIAAPLKSLWSDDVIGWPC